MHRRLALLLSSIALCAAMQTARAEIVVRDDAARPVHLASPARRVVSLAPHLTEDLFDVGAGSSVIAVSAYSDHPVEATRLPNVGGLSGLDVERIVALKPDLVVAWRSGTPEAQLAALEQLGIPVFRSEPKSLDDIATTLERLGRLTGHAAEGEARAAHFRRRLAELRTHDARPPVRVFYQVWNPPLMTVGRPHVITEAIALCGGRNVFGDLPALAPTVDPEAVVAADPEWIVTTDETGTRAADLAQWKRWPTVSAVKHDRFLFLPASLITRHTSRMLDGIAELCATIRPTRVAGTAR